MCARDGAARVASLHTRAPTTATQRLTTSPHNEPQPQPKPKPNQAVILADVDLSAQTLYPLTHDLPKSLLPLANRPLLQYQLDLLQASGFSGK